jgi:hypothetical protein
MNISLKLFNIEVLTEIGLGDPMTTLPETIIENRIHVVRGKRVMLDKDLSELYEVETKSLNLAVKRNRSRFPTDFMFQLTKAEARSLRFQFETSKRGRGGRRYLPYAFFQEGVAMLSSALNSERAIRVNVQIMRTFSKIRGMLSEHKELKKKIDEMEAKYDHQFKVVFRAIKRLIEPPRNYKKKIGFHT